MGSKFLIALELKCICFAAFSRVTDKRHSSVLLLCQTQRWQFTVQNKQMEKIERWYLCVLTVFLMGHHEERSSNYSNTAGVFLPPGRFYRPVVYCELLAKD